MGSTVARGLRDIGKALERSCSEDIKHAGEIMRKVGFDMTEQTRTALPTWVQEIAGKAMEVNTGAVHITGKDGVRETHIVRECIPKMADVCASVPRLIEAAEGMAQALEVVLEDCGIGQHVQMAGKCRLCGNYTWTRELTICKRCACKIIAQALAKYRGEVDA